MTAAPSIAEVSFLVARRATDRTACTRWIQAQGVDLDNDEAARAARQHWQGLPLLLRPEVRALSRTAVERSRAGVVGGETPFPASIWYGGATDTYDGFRFKGTVGDFVTHVLEARAKETAAKRCGWVVTPTTCVDGHRVNASTAAVHALNFDCDGRGVWDGLLAELDALGLAYVAYQSGGWSPSTPKWHILIPLAQPFDTSSPEKIDAWKAAYTTARVAFGALASLPGEGFDPTVETPAVPVFITERRSAEDPPRQVRWRAGSALNLGALVAALPAPPAESLNPIAPRAATEIMPLDDERIERIVAALTRATANVPADRRTLYLALPGALLDRGVDPDDVRTIIESVSERYPRPDPEKHRDNVHNAETTIAKWERGEVYTRIGTLVGSWPAVVAAIDDVLPNPTLAATEAMLAEMGRSRASAGAPANSPTQPLPEMPQSFGLEDLRRRLVDLRRRKRRAKDIHQRIRGVILGALLDGEDLVPYGGDGKPVDGPDGRPIDRDEAIAVAIRMISYKLPVGTVFEAVEQILRPSLGAMLQSGETLDELLRRAKNRFLFSVGKRVEDEKKQRADEVSSAERMTHWLDRQAGGQK